MRKVDLDTHFTNLDVIITKDNVQYLGENIALCSMKHLLPYRNIEQYYYGLIKDIHCHNDINRALSDGYDFAQAAILFLCEHIGKKLGDTILNKYGKPITIRHGCASVIGHMVYKQYKTYKNTKPIHRNDVVKTIKPFEENNTEESYERAEYIIKRMNLTKKQKATLECYLKGMGVCEIARFLSIANSTVWRSRMILQRKYNSL